MILGIWDSLGELVGQFYDLLDGGMGFIWDWPGIYAVFVVAIIVGVTSVSAQYILVDQKRMKQIRKELAEFNKKMRQAQLKGSKKEQRKLEVRKKQISKLNAEMMGMSTRPMFLTIIPIMIFFGWVRSQPVAAELVIDLPFTLPYFGDSLGWLGWYLLCSFFFSQTLRKVLDMA